MKLKSRLSPKDILLQAADLIDSKGWTQRRYTHHGYCAVGAINKVTSGNAMNGYEGWGARDALTHHLDTDDLIAWNDHPGRTQEEVTATFREVAAKL